MWNVIKSWYINFMLKVVSAIMQHLVAIKATLPVVRSAILDAPIEPTVRWPAIPSNTLLLDQELLNALKMGPFDFKDNNVLASLLANKERLTQLRNIELVRDAVDQLLDENERKMAFRLDAIMHQAITFEKDVEAIAVASIEEAEVNEISEKTNAM